MSDLAIYDLDRTVTRRATYTPFLLHCAVRRAPWRLLLLPVTSWVYAVVAVLGGTWFVLQAHRLHGSVAAGREVAPMRLFHLSNAYLCVLFASIAVDAALGFPVLGFPG